jgi:hypothetical protein
MNIKKDFQSDSEMNANDAMDSSMGYIFENFIEPKESELTEDQAMMLAVIGVTFKMIAEKATAYENMIAGEGENNYRN